ncbi:phosphate-starvation-inducible PsiE family protein [Hydrogenivirga sp. 128-5-R1-1]|uniref:phosphate-starvation-inducible PsiE family protein n=1 Tax=Hydrogenivirga sp. 128-5-R1-1 TaxID=392423 RepID=UPI00015F0CB1|nr:phosphate-starvation-inducible PsiE family protein [Hydrogenivirga sp. 128-5-R1-1]EDP75796.1 hypothetical protein HG1285_05705 [Hydrogenivirga sp. 128-5-R1-1]
MKFLFSDKFSRNALEFYNKVVNLLVILTVPIIILTLITAIFIILYDLRLFTAHIVEGEFRLEHEEAFKLLIKNILNFFVLIELFRVFLDVIEYKRIRKRQMLEAGIVFVVREIVIAMFDHRFSYTDLIGYSVLILALGITYVLMERSWFEFVRLSRRRTTDSEFEKGIKRVYRKLKRTEQ